MSLQSQIFKKITELEPNHKKTELEKHPIEILSYSAVKILKIIFFVYEPLVFTKLVSCLS